jgi:hypothetical protein
VSLVLRCTGLTPTQRPAAQVSRAASTARGVAGSVKDPETPSRAQGPPWDFTLDVTRSPGWGAVPKEADADQTGVVYT